MNGDDLRAFLDALNVSQEARDIIWASYIRQGATEYARGRTDGYREGYSEGVDVANSDWP